MLKFTRVNIFHDFLKDRNTKMSETKPALQGRVLEIEWMKAVAVIGMVLVHVSMSSSGLSLASFLLRW